MIELAKVLEKYFGYTNNFTKANNIPLTIKTHGTTPEFSSKVLEIFIPSLYSYVQYWIDRTTRTTC